MIKSKFDVVLQKLSMIFLALFPILNGYQFFLFLTIGSLPILALLGLKFIKNPNLKIVYFPKRYLILWFYLVISYFLSSLGYLEMGIFVPGGLAFCLFSVLLGFLTLVFDYNYFKKIYRLVFIICAGILIVQEFFSFSMGIKLPMVLPFGETTYGISVKEIIAVHMVSPRSSSIFFEPAHMAMYALPLLTMELFDKNGSHKLFNLFSLIIIASLLLLRSGNGMLGITVLLTIKVISYIRNGRNFKSLFLLLLIIPIALYAWNSYTETEVGSAVLERTQELTLDKDAHSFTRIGRGYFVYGEMPFFNQIFGMSGENLIQREIIRLEGMGSAQALYFNGVQSILIFTGILGLFMWLLFFTSIYRSGTTLCKVSLIMFLAISLISSTYLSPIMIIVILLAISQDKRRLLDNKS